VTAAVLGTDPAAQPSLPPKPARRGVELALILFAALLAASAQVAQSIGRTNAITSDVARYAGSLLALTLVAHLAVRRLAPAADPLLLPMVTLLNGIGLALIARIDASPRFDPVAPLQLIWLAIGTVAFVAVLAVVRDHRVLARYGYTCALVGLVLLLLPTVLPARFSEVNGAKVWIRFSGFSFQPSEVSKLLLVVFFASYLVAKRDVLSVVTRSVLGLPLPRARDLGPVLLAWLASLAVLVVEHDLGSSLLFFGIFVSMLYVATQRASWLVIGLLLFAGGATASYSLFPVVQKRVDIWLHAFQGTNPTNSSYQLVQGLFGLASGGLFGTGLGRGDPETVPFSRTDFIMAALGEELGLVGVFAVLVIYALIVARGFRAALGVRDSFGKLLAAGLATSLTLQIFVVVGGVTRLIPLTGITTPFLSYGGSSLVANYALIALLLRVSDAARRPPPALRPEPPTALTELVRLPS
jgi:cell division protein FtsW (lipid II flippase)